MIVIVKPFYNIQVKYYGSVLKFLLIQNGIFISIKRDIVQVLVTWSCRNKLHIFIFIKYCAYFRVFYLRYITA